MEQDRRIGGAPGSPCDDARVPLGDVQLREVRYFLAVAEALSFRRAAAALHLTPPALSQAIRKLERKLGVVLFERSTRHVALSPAGTELLAEARRLAAAAELFDQRGSSASADDGHSAGQRRPLVRVNLPSEANTTGRAVIAAMIEHDPAVTVVRSSMGSAEAVEALAAHRLDAAVGRAWTPGEAVASELIRREPLVVFAPPHHRLAGRPAVRLSDLDGEAVYAPSAAVAPAWRGFLDELFIAAGTRPAIVEAPYGRGPIVFADVAAEHAVLAIAVESDAAVARGVAVLPIADRSAVYPWSLYWRSPAGAAAGRVIEAARTALRDGRWLPTAAGSQVHA